jgi:hypothetical protein
MVPAGDEFSVEASIVSLKLALTRVPVMTLLFALVLVDTFVAPSLGFDATCVGADADVLATIVAAENAFVLASVPPPHAASKVLVSKLVSHTFSHTFGREQR